LTWITSSLIINNQRNHTRYPNQESQEVTQLLDDKEYFSDYCYAITQGLHRYHITMIIKRKALLEAGLFREHIRYGEDMDLWWRIAFKNPAIGYAKEHLAIYNYFREGSLSDTMPKLEMDYNFITIFNDNLKLATQYGQEENVRKFAFYHTRGLILKYYNGKDAKTIRKLLKIYNNILPNYFKLGMYLLTSTLIPNISITRMIASKL